MSVLNPLMVTVQSHVLPGDWHSAAHFRPFLPGVYEVDPVQTTAMSSVRRYSYFDGVDFKPADHTVEGAHTLRFCTSYAQVQPITAFRGLSEEV